MKIISRLVLVCMMGILSSCGGSKDDTTDPCANVSAITAVTNPAVNAVVPAAPGPNFDLSVNITSALGTGASIEVTAKPEAGGNAFFTVKREASLFNNFTITNTPVNTAAIVEINIISNACNNVQWTGSYRYSRK